MKKPLKVREVGINVEQKTLLRLDNHVQKITKLLNFHGAILYTQIPIVLFFFPVR